MRSPWFLRASRLAVLCTPLFAFAILVGNRIKDDNFAVVSATLFRSGQLRADEWNESFAAHPYRSVLNLRGSQPGASWYRLERAFGAQHGLQHFDVALSPFRAPSMEQMEQLIRMMRAAPKPLLIHCKSGADRTGLVTALYRYGIDNVPATEAKMQLSLWYGHVPWLEHRTAAMDRALTAFIAAHPNGGPPAESR